MSKTIIYRELTLNDYDAFNALRTKALNVAPEAFLMTNEEELEVRKQRFNDTPNHSTKFIIGAFDDGQLIGMMGFVKQERQKIKHKGEIWGIFVSPEKQRMGIATKLLNIAIEKAFEIEELKQITLGVNVANVNAITLYEKAGFKAWGTEKDALCIDGQYYDEIIMVKFR